MKRECETCIRNKTMYCPNSNECMTTDDKSYYQNKIMLLEENKQLKEELEEYKNPIKYFKYANKNVINENKQLKDNWDTFKKILEKNWETAQDIWYVKLINMMNDIEKGDDE